MNPLCSTVILAGVSGSGKSTYAARVHPRAVYVASADKFFVRDGVYTFDVSRLGAAHSWCLLEFSQRVFSNVRGTIVVDNTNCTLVELAPYIALSLAHNRTTTLVRLHVDPYVAFSRTQHNVPLHAIEKQRVDFAANAVLPAYWIRHPLFHVIEVPT